MEQKFTDCAARILKGIGISADKDFVQESYVSNEVKTKEYDLHGTLVQVSVVLFCGKSPSTCRIDIDFSLSEDGVLANTFMNHCAAKEGTPKNHSHEYCAGPTYRDWASELRGGKQTFALSPWNNRMFYVRSEGYLEEELDEAADNAIALARQFSSHLSELPSLRFWNPSDREVVAKAKEIVANAALQETDCDRENKAHWIKDGNSFFKGWFYPFNDHGKGTFDTPWPSSVHYAASGMGIKGSFEYAVACILLEDADFIAKARKACRIRTKTINVKY